jgi:hypothetical protein
MNITLTLCYNNSKTLEKSIDRYYEMCYQKPDAHYLVDNEYPLKKDEVKETIKKLSDKYGCTVLEPKKNLGLRQGLLWGLEQAKLNDDDKVIIYDSSDYPITKNFDKALLEILSLNEDIVGVTLSNKKLTENLEKIKDQNSGYYYFEGNEKSFGSSIVAFKHFINKYTQAEILPINNYFGDGNNTHSKLKTIITNMNKRYVVLSDYNEEPHFLTFQGTEDPEYFMYKQISIRTRFKEFSFEEYLTKMDTYNKTSQINAEINILNNLLN